MIQVILISGFLLLEYPHITHIETQIGTELFPDPYKKTVLIKCIIDYLLT